MSIMAAGYIVVGTIMEPRYDDFSYSGTIILGTTGKTITHSSNS